MWNKEMRYRRCPFLKFFEIDRSCFRCFGERFTIKQFQILYFFSFAVIVAVNEFVLDNRLDEKFSYDSCHLFGMIHRKPYDGMEATFPTGF